MSETVYYVDSTGGTLSLSTLPAKFLGGDGLDTWHVSPVYDPAPGELSRFAGYALDATEWALSFAIGANSYTEARGTLAAWRKVFMRDVSRGAAGSLVVVYNGGTYRIDAAIMTPEVEGPIGQYVGVTLKFQSKSPFWELDPAQEASGTFSAGGTVSVSWDNTGDYRTWPIHRLVGAAGTPRITNVETGDYIEIGTAWAGASDEVWIWTDEPLIRYYAGGTGAGDPDSGENWTKYAGIASVFFPLDPGAGTLSLTASAGSPTYSLQYSILKAGLG